VRYADYHTCLINAGLRDNVGGDFSLDRRLRRATRTCTRYSILLRREFASHDSTYRKRAERIILASKRRGALQHNVSYAMQDIWATMQVLSKRDLYDYGSMLCDAL
jgi:hypothetical protein